MCSTTGFLAETLGREMQHAYTKISMIGQHWTICCYDVAAAALSILHLHFSLARCGRVWLAGRLLEGCKERQY
jgi:hypothetical protein